MSFGGQDSSTPDQLPQQFKDLRDPLANLFQSFFGGGGSNVFGNFGASGGVPTQATGFNPAAFTASLGAPEQAQLGRIGARAAAAPTGGGPETDAASAFRTGIIRGDQLEPDERTRRTLFAPILDAFGEATRQGRSAFTRAGQRVQESSPFARAQALSEGRLADALGGVETRLRESGRERQAQFAQGAEGQEAVRAGADQARASTAIQRLQALALPRLVEQLGIDKGLEQFNRMVQQLLAITAPVLGSESSGFSVGLGSVAGGATGT